MHSQFTVRHVRLLCVSFILCALACAAALPAFISAQAGALAPAAAGDLDPTFGSGGKVVTSFPGGLDTAAELLVQTDGKLVVVGSSGSDFALARFNTNGSLDTTFGTGGIVHTDFPTGQGGLANAAVLQPDGKIVAVGSANDPSSAFASAFALVRYNPDGSLDTSFDTDGRVLTSFPGSSATANAVVRQTDGKLVVAGVGTDNTTFNSIYALTRYNPDGSLDTTFDTDGRVTTDFPGVTFEEAHAVALQTDGKIVAAGLGSSSFTVARYNTNGSLDTSFDMDGLVTTAFGGTFEEADALAIQTDGKIIAAGQTSRSVAADDNFALARYNTDGSLDTSFDMDGKVVTDFGLVDAAEAVVLQTDGRIVAAGRAGTIPMGSFFALARYNTDGSLDNNFDTDGKVLTDTSGGRFNLGVQSAALQTDGKIVVAGDNNSSGQRDFGLARYNTDGSLDTTFDGDGQAVLDFPLNEDAVTALVRQSDGKIIAVGRAQLQVRIKDTQDPNFQIARYNTDGSLDPTYGTNGLVSTGFGQPGSDDFANAAALQADGKLVVVGQTGAQFSQIPSANTAFLTARYNTDGSLDSSFGVGGFAKLDLSSTHDTALAVAIQADGKIVVVGTNGADFYVARYNTNGTLDNQTFGGLIGVMAIDFNGGTDVASAVLIQPDGKIIIAGTSSGDFALARVNSNGSTDTTFGSLGKVTTDFNNGADMLSKIVLQSDGKIVAAGSATTNPSSSGSDFALARYNTDGSLDTANFGTGGKVTTDFGGFDQANGVALQTDGRIVAAGLYFVTNNAPAPAPATTAQVAAHRPTAPDAPATFIPSDQLLPAAPAATAAAFFAVARYTTSGMLDSTFGTGGKVTTDFFGIDNQANAVLVQPDNKTIAGGYTDTGSSRDFALARYQADAATPTPTPTATATPTPSPQTIQFPAVASVFPEGFVSALVMVSRTGDTSGAATVDFQTAQDAAFIGCDVVNGTASERCDFTTTLTTVRFAPGETEKFVAIFLTDDSYVEGDETFQVLLSNPTGGATLGRASSLVLISDNDTAPGPNPIDNATFFVKRHYIDFLNREGEDAGVNAWVNQLNNCPAGAQTCDRVETSSRFFRSVEFMLKGAFVIRYYKVSLGTNPNYREFTRDSQRVTGQTAAEVNANRDAFMNEWVQRSDFRAIYDALSNQAYVDKLEMTAGVTLQNKQQLVNNLNTGAETRAQVLRDIVESNEVKTKMYNDAFVLMEYFGYLRRDAESAGFNAWLNYLNAHPSDYRTMVNGFVNSIEYRKRFGRP